MRYVIVNNGVVVSVILWDGVAPYTPPQGTLVPDEEAVAGPGDTYADGVFTPAPPVEGE